MAPRGDSGQHGYSSFDQSGCALDGLLRAHIYRAAARTNYSRTSIHVAQTRWLSDWVRTDPAVFEMVRRVSMTQPAHTTIHTYGPQRTVITDQN